MRWLILPMFVLALMGPATAVEPDEILSDPVLENRARELSAQLRCLVCQNQSIDDSDAPLARDLRILVRERLTSGDTDAQVIDFVVARYGEFVLLKPRLNEHTLVLWLTPPLALLLGGFALWRLGRRKGNPAAGGGDSGPGLTPDEEARLERLLAADSAPDKSL